MLGGNISVESKLNVGSKFIFTHPYQVAEEISGQPNSSIEEKITGFRQKILIAEDDLTSRIFLEEVLKSTQAYVIHAADGMEAVNIVNADPDIDLVLMDIKMPVLQGHLAAQIIKKDNPSIPIIAQTAYAIPSEIAKYENYFDDYIIKPINETTLFKKIGHYLPIEKQEKQ